MNGRNHYRGRPDPAVVREERDKLYIENVHLREQNLMLEEKVEQLTSMLDSFQRMLDTKIASAQRAEPSSQRPPSPPTSVSGDDTPDIFINPMDEDSSLKKSFEDLGEVKKEKSDSDQVDKLRKLLGK